LYIFVICIQDLDDYVISCIGSLSMFRILTMSRISCDKNDFKNSTLSTVSFFLLSDLILLIVISLLKIVFLAYFICSFNKSISRYLRTCSLTMISSPLQKSSSRSTTQIRNAPYSDWKINGLCWFFRYFIYWR